MSSYQYYSLLMISNVKVLLMISWSKNSTISPMITISYCACVIKKWWWVDSCSSLTFETRGTFQNIRDASLVLQGRAAKSAQWSGATDCHGWPCGHGGHPKWCDKNGTSWRCPFRHFRLPPVLIPFSLGFSRFETPGSQLLGDHPIFRRTPHMVNHSKVMVIFQWFFFFTECQ